MHFQDKDYSYYFKTFDTYSHLDLLFIDDEFYLSNVLSTYIESIMISNQSLVTLTDTPVSLFIIRLWSLPVIAFCYKAMTLIRIWNCCQDALSKLWVQALGRWWVGNWQVHPGFHLYLAVFLIGPPPTRSTLTVWDRLKWKWPLCFFEVSACTPREIFLV